MRRWVILVWPAGPWWDDIYALPLMLRRPGPGGATTSDPARAMAFSSPADAADHAAGFKAELGGWREIVRHPLGDGEGN